MAGNTIRTLCQFCHTNCGIIVKKSSTGTLTVEGNPDHPVNRGRCCPKAAAIPEVIRSKERLKHPLKKTKAGFEKISWDEALRLASDRLSKIRERYGPLSLVRCMGAPVSYQCRDGFLEFMGAFGSPNMTGAGNLCMVPRMLAFKTVLGESRAEPDYDSSSLVLFWGANPLVTERFAAFSAYNGIQQIIPRLKNRGGKIITIDPVRTKTVQQSDQWIRINPGTDIALGLAMIHVIIKEGLYDKGFVEQYTDGFDALEKHVQAHNPQWAEPITGVPESEIVNLARTYAETKPAAIYEGNGFDMYVNGVDGVRVVAILIALTGNLDIPGGNVIMPFIRQSTLPTKDVPREKKLARDQFPIFWETPFPAVKEAILGNTDNCPRAMIVHHANPVLVQSNEKRTRQAMEKMDFVIASDIFPTATTEMADLILPVTSTFESYGYRAYSSVEGGFMALASPVADPVGETRSVFEVEYALAEKMGLHHDYPFNDALSWIKFMIKPSGVPFERLDDEQIVYATPPVQYRKYTESGFNTPSGKVAFYSQLFEKNGYSPIPSYTEPGGEPLDRKSQTEKGFSLLGTNRRPGLFVHTKFKNLAALSKSYPEPLAIIHVKDAADRGVAEGDMVEVTSPQGSIRLKAKLGEDMNPGLVLVDFGWGNPTDGKASINRLTNDTYYDPVSGGTPNRIFPCEVKVCQNRRSESGA